MRQLLRTLFTIVATLFVCFAAEHALTLSLTDGHASSAQISSFVLHQSQGNDIDFGELYDDCQATANALSTAETLTRIASSRPARVIPAQSGGKRSATSATTPYGKLTDLFNQATLRNAAQSTINFSGAHIVFYVFALRHIIC